MGTFVDGGCGCSPLSKCYYHCKSAWLDGGTLTERELLLVGALPRYEPPRRSNGWRTVAAFLARFNREDDDLEARLRGIRYVVDINGEEHELVV